LRAVLTDLEAKFGQVNVVSTKHLHTGNHSAGSIREKLHHDCRAVDIKVDRNPAEMVAFLRTRPEVAGINHYRNRVIHFDYNPAYKGR
jgi:hypothetical protein